jgi:guanylate kinase
VEKARQEMTFASSFDHVLVNDDLHQACDRAVHQVNLFLS